jgi:hypothetical protein
MLGEDLEAEEGVRDVLGAAGAEKLLRQQFPFRSARADRGKTHAWKLAQLEHVAPREAEV